MGKGMGRGGPLSDRTHSDRLAFAPVLRGVGLENVSREKYMQGPEALTGEDVAPTMLEVDH